MGLLKNESFDLVVIDGIGRCPFLKAETLGRLFVTICPTTFGVMNFALPEPVSYVPAFDSSLTDHMDLWKLSEGQC